MSMRVVALGIGLSDIPNKFTVFSLVVSRGHVYGYHDVLIESRVHGEEEYLKNLGMLYLALVALEGGSSRSSGIHGLSTLRSSRIAG